jgi:hypothetical protein
MRFYARVLLPVSTLIVPALAVDAPPASVADSVKPVLQNTEIEFLSVAKAMPERLYGFAPSGPGFEGVRTFAEQIKHVACSNFAFFNEIDHKTPPEHCENGGPARATTKSELIQYLRDSFEYGNKVLAAMTDTTAMEKVPPGQYWGNNTSLTVAIAAVWHIADPYGQLVPYLRMNNIVPPPTERRKATVH